MRDLKRGLEGGFVYYGYGQNKGYRSQLSYSECDGARFERAGSYGVDTDCAVRGAMLGGPFIRKEDGVTIAIGLGERQNGRSVMILVPEARYDDLTRFARLGRSAPVGSDRLDDLKALVAVPAPSRAFLNFYASNHCDGAVGVAVRYKALDDDWVKDGWMIVQPGGLRWLGFETRNRIVYWSALKARFDGKTFRRDLPGWSGDGWEGKVDGIRTRMRTYKAGPDAGDEVIEIRGCD